jgi:site-specific DNA-methyltransferase (adenine-specific)
MSSAAQDSAITLDDHGATRGCLHPLVREFLDVRHADCMELMAGTPNGHFDLAIVDPPYGIERFQKGFGTTRFKMDSRAAKDGLKWDNAPSQEYFEELRRVSKNQIVWGANYFPPLWEKPCKGFIYWAKSNPVANFADGEMAWTSFDRPARQFDYAWGGLSDGVVGRNKKEKSIHPTQKPVGLYSWLLANYAKEGDRILDTHMGSGSIAIACHYARLHLTACEIDEDYFREACARITRETAQDTFDFPNTDYPHQKCK